jgi:hypothetical protein
MKFKTTTIILVLLALGLGSFVYITEIKKKSIQEKADTKQNTEALIFNFAENNIESLTIETEDTTLKFEPQSEENQPWKMVEPEQVTASEPSVSFLVNLLLEGKANQSFTVNKDQLSDYGLDKPIAKIFFTLKKENEQIQKNQLFLGKPNFDNTSIYAQVSDHNLPENQAKVVLVSKSFQYAVERDYEDWKQKQEDKSLNTNSNEE